MTKAEAEAAGFFVDTSCYPWFAYTGSRFSPTRRAVVLTDLEASLLAALQKILDIKGSTGGNQSLVDEFKNIASLAIAKASP